MHCTDPQGKKPDNLGPQSWWQQCSAVGPVKPSKYTELAGAVCALFQHPEDLGLAAVAYPADPQTKHQSLVRTNSSAAVKTPCRSLVFPEPLATMPEPPALPPIHVQTAMAQSAAESMGRELWGKEG